MKKIFSLILAVLASLVNSYAGTRYLIDGIEYELEYPDFAYVTWYNNFNYVDSYTEDTIIIPEGVIHEGSAYIVERILDDAFRNSHNLRYISIPETVTQIGERAFQNADSLPAITLPSGLTILNANTFNYCSSLKSVTWPQKLHTIKDFAFMRCTALDSLELPASLLYIGSWAFAYCETLSSIVIPDKTLAIGEFAFRCCYGLKSVTLNQKIKALPERSFSDCRLESINIPENIDSLGEGVFENNSHLRSVHFSSKITEIPENAFYYCRALDSVDLPSGVTSIGKWAFAYCPSLHVISIPQALTTIHEEAFKNSKAIYDVTINAPQLFNQEGGISAIFGKQVKRYALGDAFTAIDDDAFAGCDSLQEIVVGPNVKTIGKNAFANLTELRTVVLSDAVESIDEGAFANCPKLERIIIGRNMTSIAADAFTGCTNLQTIEINSPVIFNQKFKNEYNDEYSIKDIFGEQVTNYVIGDSITAINAYTFLNCTNLTDVTIGKNVETIDHHAFYGCSALTTITIPEKVTTIRHQVFQESGLTSVHWNAIDCSFSSGYYSLFHGLAAPLDTIYLGPKVEAIPSKMYDGMQMSAYTLPAHIKRIGQWAFQGCSNLSAVYISDLKAWCELEGISELLLIPYDNTPARDLYLNGQLIQGDFVVPANITKINPYAFYNYPHITSVTIPDEVVASIGEYAFACPNITFVTVGSGVTSMYGAFKACPLLTTVTTNTSAHTDDYSGVHMVDIFGTQVTDYTLGENVAQIGRGMFQNATSLRSVTMSEGVKRIGKEAFSGCTGLQTMTIADHVTKIEEDAFSGCTGLTEVTIGDGVDTIEESAFKNCSNLRKFTFGKSIKEMDVTLFSKCTRLDTVVWNVAHFPDFENGNSTIFYYKPSNTAYVDLRDKIVSFTLGESVEYIPAFLCNQMTKLNTIDFPQSVDSIGKSAFSGCTGLTQLQIGKGVNYLGEYTFANCSNITEVDIPSSVKTIEGGAFNDCSKLTAIYEHATTPPEMVRWAFNSTPNSKTLYVPKGTVSKYQNANPWYNFYNICEMPAEREEQALEEIHLEGAQPTKVLHNGQLYILRGGNAYTPTGQIVK